MFDRTRDWVANGLEVLAARVATDATRPGISRVAQPMRTLAGVRITPDTAVTVSAVWACLRYLSQTVGMLPWHVMLKTKTGAEIQDRHTVDWLLYREPNPELTSFQFRETLLHWALRWGNGYAEIEVDSVGRPVGLWPIHPQRVIVQRDEASKLFYEINNSVSNQPKVYLPRERMFHIRGFGDDVVGVNVMDYAAESIGWAKAAQIFGAAFFGNGMTMGSVVVNKKPLKPEGLRRQKAEMAGLHKGPYKAWGTAHLDNDADIKPLGVTPEEGQFITTNQHLVEEVCRWFGVPPHKAMHLLRATFSNIEHQAIEVVQDSVNPWVKRFEDEANMKLFGQNRSNLYTKINMRALLRGDMAARVAYYEGMLRMGSYSPNKVLDYEDENGIGPDGDIHVMQSQFVTLDKIKNPPQPPVPKPAPMPRAPAPAPSNDDDEATDPKSVKARRDMRRLLTVVT